MDLGSVLAEFLPSFPSQIWMSGVTFVTFFGYTKCDASLLPLSHFLEESDALAYENCFFTSDVFRHILPEECLFLAPPVQTFFEREEM